MAAVTELLPITTAQRFIDSSGGRLFQLCIRPNNEATARLVVVHGYGDHGGRFSHFMRWMAERGIACYATDLRGQGRSQGRRGHVARWDRYLDDLDASLEHASSSGPDADRPLFVLGHSHGGLVVAVAGERGILGKNCVRGVVLTAPYFKSKMAIPRTKILLGRSLGLLVPWLQIPTGLQNEWMSSDPEMVEDTRQDPYCARVATPRWYTGHLRAQREVMDGAPQFRLPLLVLVAGADRIADTSTAQEFVARAGSKDKSFRLYPGLLHELLRERGREAIFVQISDWLRSHVRGSDQ